MKKTLITAALVACGVFAGSAHAAGDCAAQAAEKKLAGAAKNSFLKKCEKTAAGTDAASACDKTAAEKKLAGAAKNSFLKKCRADTAAAGK